MNFIKELALSYDDISIIPQYSSTGRNADLKPIGKHAYPFIPSPMINVASGKMLKYFSELGCISIVHRYFDNAEQQFNFAVESGCDISKLTFAVGSISKYLNWIDYLLQRGITKFCIDMAHGHSAQSIDTIKYLAFQLSKIDPDEKIIMAGNVCTAEGAISLAAAGCTMIRVGIASGAICKTWMNTGVGLPMVTTIINIRNVFNNDPNRPHIIADGGIRNGGDIAKALACGADYVMFGKILASTSFADGVSYNKDGEFCCESETPHWKEYFGMASTKARSTTSSQNKSVSIEGAEGLLKYTGETPTVINNLIENLKATCGYVGANNLTELYTNSKLQQITVASHSEKLIHLDCIHN